jgi:protein O-mannosyl-transferase
VGLLVGRGTALRGNRGDGAAGIEGVTADSQAAAGRDAVRAPSWAHATAAVRTWWRSHAALAQIALLVLVSCAVYADTLSNRFAYDDEIQVVQNPYIRRLASLPTVFAMPTWPGSVYRPLVLATYSLTHALVGSEPWLYHATNVLLHAAVVALAYLVLVRLVGRGLAFVTCLLFAVHPIHVDAVAGVANRTELMGAALGLVCIWLVLRWDEGRLVEGTARSRRHGTAWLVALFVVYLMALLSKESVLTLFLLVPLCLWVANPAGALPGRSTLRARYAPPLVVMGSALAICVAVRGVVLGELLRDPAGTPALDNPLGHVGAPERLLRALILLGRYLAEIVFPARLSPDYSLGAGGLGEDALAPSSLVHLALVVGLVALVGAAWRRDRRVVFFGLWFGAAFALTANLLFAMPTVFGERLAYLPSLGVCGLLAWALLRLGPGPRAVALSAIVIVLAARTWSYGAAWRDNDTLFRYAMGVVPGSARVQIGYAEALSRHGAFAAARRRFSEVVASYPLHAEPHYGIAVIDLQEGRRAEAVAGLERTLALAPNHLPALMLLGRLRLRDGQVDDAARLFVRVLNRDNFHFEARLGILTASLERGNLAQAVALRDELSAVDPEHAELLAVSRELDLRLAAPRSHGASDARTALAPAG